MRSEDAGVRWLVDGMNLIGSRPNRWWNDPDGAVRRLIDELGVATLPTTRSSSCWRQTRTQGPSAW